MISVYLLLDPLNVVLVYSNIFLQFGNLCYSSKQPQHQQQKNTISLVRRPKWREFYRRQIVL